MILDHGRRVDKASESGTLGPASQVYLMLKVSEECIAEVAYIVGACNIFMGMLAQCC